MTRTAKEVLIDVRRLLADPSCWTRRSNARDSRGHAVYPERPEAVCWCLSGAIARWYGRITRTISLTPGFVDPALRWLKRS